MPKILKFIPTVLAFIAGINSPVAAETSVKSSRPEASAFVTADSDESRTLNAGEFKIFINALADSGQSAASTVRMLGLYGMAFKKVDVNNDGMLSPEELRNADRKYRQEPLKYY